MKFIASFVLIIEFAFIKCQSNTAGAKICVSQEKFPNCELLKQFASESNINLDCVSARDRLDCFRKIEMGEANIVSVPSNEAYTAATHFPPWIPLLEEKTDENGEFMYESVAVVRKDLQIKSLDDLKGKKSCHTGYRRNAGWNIPISLLNAKNVLPAVCTTELESVSKFFSKSCVPGNWSKNAQLNTRLKKDFSNMCELCSVKCNSSATDIYSGYEGALKCLVNNSADIAFTKYQVALNFSREYANFSANYRLLCSNGTLSPLNELCHWGARANPLIISRESLPESNRSMIRAQITKLLAEKPWPSFAVGTLLQRSNSYQVRNVSYSIRDHLIKANYTIALDKPNPCTEKYLRLCVASPIELSKCTDFEAAAFSQMLRPRIECVQSSDCIQKLRNNEAELMFADVSDTYNGLANLGFKSLMEEIFPTGNFSYYLVAVTRSNSSIKALQDLKGRNSCHSKFTKSVDWSVVKGNLVLKKLLKETPCNLNDEISKFFKSSCVPEAPRSLPSLCSLCKDKNKCSANDEYAGFDGAIRCLTNGGGDVAFVSQSSLSNLPQNQFQLLCLTNGVKPINEFENCNWAKIPGKHLLISQATESASEQSLLLMMVESNFLFTSMSPTFKLYAAYNNTSVIFTNGTIGVIPNVDPSSARSVLGENMTNIMQSSECLNSATKLQFSLFLLITLFVINF